MKRLITAVMVLSVLAGGYYYYQMANQPADEQMRLYGNIEIRQTDLSFQTGGRIARLLAEEGDTVEAGQVVAELEASDYVVSVQQARAQLAQAEADEAARVDVYNRNAGLLAAGAISRLEFENLTHAKDSAQAVREAALAQLSLAENKLSYTKLYAPEAGIVISRVQEPGAVVSQGQTVFTLAKPQPLWVRAYVPEEQLGNIYYDMMAQVVTDSRDLATGERRSYQGRIGYIAPSAEFTPKTVQTESVRSDLVYRIRVYIDEPDKLLRQGMPVTVILDLQTSEAGQP